MIRAIYDSNADCLFGYHIDDIEDDVRENSTTILSEEGCIFYFKDDEAFEDMAYKMSVPFEL